MTEVLRPFSGLDKVDKYVLENAAVRGTKVHVICDAIMQGIGIPDVPEELKGYIESFETWACGKDFVKKPPRMYCDTLGITGEIDGIYQSPIVEGVLVRTESTLFDLKTPSRESKTWALQLSAYHYLARLNGHQIDKIESVRLRKDGKEAVVHNYDPAVCLPIFKCCLCAYRFFNPKKKSDT